MEGTIKIGGNETESSTLTSVMSLENPETENSTAEQRSKSVKVAADVQVLSYTKNFSYSPFFKRFKFGIIFSGFHREFFLTKKILII